MLALHSSSVSVHAAPFKITMRTVHDGIMNLVSLILDTQLRSMMEENCMYKKPIILKYPIIFLITCLRSWVVINMFKTVGKGHLKSIQTAVKLQHFMKIFEN